MFVIMVITIASFVLTKNNGSIISGIVIGFLELSKMSRTRKKPHCTWILINNEFFLGSSKISDENLFRF